MGMRVLLLILFAVSLVFLSGPQAEAKIVNRGASVEVAIVVIPYVQGTPCSTVVSAAVIQTVPCSPVEIQTIEVQQVQVQQGSRKLTLREKAKARRKARQEIRALRVATFEAVAVDPCAFVTAVPACLGMSSE